MSTDITNAEIQSVFDHCTRHEDDAVPLHIRFARALLSRQVPSPPAGDVAPENWKLVPHEPTREMLDAGHEQWSRMTSYTDAWMAMWHAAPSAAPAAPVAEPRVTDEMKAAGVHEMFNKTKSVAESWEDCLGRVYLAMRAASHVTTPQVAL